MICKRIKNEIGVRRLKSFIGVVFKLSPENVQYFCLIAYTAEETRKRRRKMPSIKYIYALSIE